MLAPPYASSTVTPSTPSAPSFGQRSAGKSLARSMSAARGAIPAAANAATPSRRKSAVSPRAKSSRGREFGVIFGLPTGLLPLGTVRAGTAPPGPCSAQQAGGGPPHPPSNPHY